MQKVQKLAEILKKFEQAGIEEVKPAEELIKEVEKEFSLTSEIYILSNKQFKLIYNKNKKQIEFRTAYSNQLIDETYIKHLMLINQNKNEIEQILNE
jgi:rRNA maturation endonuclease Nob1